jgi:hypothetical protein
MARSAAVLSATAIAVSRPTANITSTIFQREAT